MTVDSEDDIRHLKAIGHICAEVLHKMMRHVRPGMTTVELDEYGRELLEVDGAHSAPKSTYRFPGTTCISVSPVIAHGIPGNYVLKDGDLIHIDVSAELDGYFADTGASLSLSKKNPQVVKLLDATRATLWKALRSAKVGNRLNIIGKVVHQEARKRGYNVIYDLTGHGIGRGLHESPSNILNYYDPRDMRVLTEGLVLAVEPFLTTGRGYVAEGEDGWSLRTIDNSMAAQFEHTIIVTRDQPIILTI